jgi:hypothetical protein
MREWIQNLLALQAVDLRVRGLKTKLATLPAEKARLDKSIEDAKTGVKRAKEALSSVERQIKDSEARIAQANADNVKLQSQTLMVKKNDEYQAMLKQIEDNKSKISDMETVEIELLDKVEAARKGVHDAEKALSDAERSVKSEIHEFAQLEKDVIAEYKELVASRPVYEKKVEQATLDVYNRLVSRGKGTPVAKVKDGTHCGNCQLKLTPQTLGQARSGVLAYCDNCSHIVYMDVPDDE